MFWVFGLALLYLLWWIASCLRGVCLNLRLMTLAIRELQATLLVREAEIDAVIQEEAHSGLVLPPKADNATDRANAIHVVVDRHVKTAQRRRKLKRYEGMPFSSIPDPDTLPDEP